MFFQPVNILVAAVDWTSKLSTIFQYNWPSKLKPKINFLQQQMVLKACGYWLEKLADIIEVLSARLFLIYTLTS
jgi:hypothetical protein